MSERVDIPRRRDARPLREGEEFGLIFHERTKSCW
jgi:hypothetical protein